MNRFINNVSLIFLLIFTFIFLSVHFWNNYSAQKELDKLNKLGYYASTKNLLEQIDSSTNKIRVMYNSGYGGYVKHPYYFENKNGDIIKVSPNGLKTSKCSLTKRFFNWGVINGDSKTPFIIKHWNRTIPSRLKIKNPGKPFRESTFLEYIKLDPTNPTFFYIFIIGILISFFIKMIYIKYNKI